jgi:hypothetical protein
MKNKKVFKSLEELSPELLASEVGDTIRQQATPEEPQPVKQDSRHIFQRVSSLAESDLRGYRGWGINE